MAWRLASDVGNVAATRRRWRNHGINSPPCLVKKQATARVLGTAPLGRSSFTLQEGSRPQGERSPTLPREFVRSGLRSRFFKVPKGAAPNLHAIKRHQFGVENDETPAFSGCLGHAALPGLRRLPRHTRSRRISCRVLAGLAPSRGRPRLSTRLQNTLDPSAPRAGLQAWKEIEPKVQFRSSSWRTSRRIRGASPMRPNCARRKIGAVLSELTPTTRPLSITPSQCSKAPEMPHAM